MLRNSLHCVTLGSEFNFFGVRSEKPHVRRKKAASNMGYSEANVGFFPFDELRVRMTDYLDWALAKRLLISSQLTVFHHAAR